MSPLRQLWGSLRFLHVYGTESCAGGPVGEALTPAHTVGCERWCSSDWSLCCNRPSLSCFLSVLGLILLRLYGYCTVRGRKYVLCWAELVCTLLLFWFFQPITIVLGSMFRMQQQQHTCKTGSRGNFWVARHAGLFTLVQL